MAFHPLRSFILAGLLFLSACKTELATPPVSPTPVHATASPTVPIGPTATPTATPKPLVVLIEPPEPETLSVPGRDLIYEFEVGGRSGYDPHPEAPDARLSGVTWGIGYDGHQNAPKIILEDWKALGERSANRLAATHPYAGVSAQQHLREVRDILVGWQIASDVFDRIDVGREFASARRAYGSTFDSLRPNAQAALISIGFNRGYSFIGDNRREMRIVRDLVPKKDYEGMADQIAASERCWRGTSIYAGMKRRRFAEAALMRKP